jgi:hypothetical protein
MANYPIIRFVDDKGNELPTNKDGIQRVQQFRQSWKVKLSNEWHGKVEIIGNNSFYLSHIAETNVWELPRGSTSKGLRGSAGIITVVLTDPHGKSIDSSETKLAIEPANFTDAQLNQMIANIGTLALSVSSCVSREISIPIHELSGFEDIGLQWLPYKGLLVTTNALLDLASVVQQNWLELEKRPLKNIKIEAGIVNRSRIHTSPKLLVKAFAEPSRQSFMGMARTETTNCPENQFLCYVLDVYLQGVAGGLIKSLKSIALALDDVPIQLIPNVSNGRNKARDDASFKKFRQNAQDKANLRNIEVIKLKKSINTKINNLKKNIEWAREARNSSLLKNIQTPISIPKTSLRLIGSPTYGAIYACFCASKGHVLEKIQNVISLFESTRKGFVRPVWEIYEIWCFVSIYSAFVLYGGMMPDGSGNLFEKIRLENGEAKIPKKQPFCLVRELSDGRELKVALTYEPDKHNSHNELRTPDIFIEISIDGLSVQKFCFDAKYRSYSDQGNKQFTKDVLDTAKERYKQQLDLKACFILHSDKNYDYWGEVQFSRVLKEKFKIETESDECANESDEYAKHEFGAIALLPENSEGQIKKIIQLLLRYHLSKSLATTCISCGYYLESTKDVFASWEPPDRYKLSEKDFIYRVISDHPKSGRGTGVYCGCPKCGDFWVVQSCRNHHHLLKSNNYFHRKSAHQEHHDKWMFICPVCGDDPSAAELKAKRGVYEIEDHNFSYEGDDDYDF